MEQYKITIKGLSPLIMHQDNIVWGEKVKQWAKDPANKKDSTAGDDRSPTWTWLGYICHDGKNIGVPSDNLMTVLREGGSKLLVGKGKETYKKQTQAGLIIDQQQWDILVNGKPISIKALADLTKENDFYKHIELVESLGFELRVKRAKVGQAQHVRVRPLFREWGLIGTLTVLDSERTGLTKEVMQLIFDQAGALCGLGDWRPSSPRASGAFGRFEARVTK